MMNEREEEPCPNCGTYSWPYGRICPGCKEVRWKRKFECLSRLRTRAVFSLPAFHEARIAYSEFEVKRLDELGHTTELTIQRELIFLRQITRLHNDGRFQEIVESDEIVGLGPPELGWIRKVRCDEPSNTTKALLDELVDEFGVSVWVKSGDVWKDASDGAPLLVVAVRMINQFTGETLDLLNFPRLEKRNRKSQSPINYNEIVDRLRKDGRKTPAALVDFMADRDRATRSEIAKSVHEDQLVEDATVRRNVNRTNSLLVGMGSVLSFRWASGYIYREISPE